MTFLLHERVNLRPQFAIRDTNETPRLRINPTLGAQCQR